MLDHSKPLLVAVQRLDCSAVTDYQSAVSRAWAQSDLNNDRRIPTPSQRFVLCNHASCTCSRAKAATR
jgi:hypothetical protein